MIEIENNNNPEETALVLIRLARVFAKDFHSDKRLIPFKKLSLKDLYEAVKKAPYLKDVIVENFIEPAIFFDPRILSRDCDDKTMFITSWAIATGKEHKFIISLMAQKTELSHITPFYIFKNKAIPFDATYPDRPSKMGRLLFNPVKTKFFDTSGKSGKLSNLRDKINELSRIDIMNSPLLESNLKNPTFPSRTHTPINP